MQHARGTFNAGTSRILQALENVDALRSPADSLLLMLRENIEIR